MLFRHGKSSWDDDSIPDRERPLAGRGKRDAQAAGQWIAEQGMVPERVMVSGAARARATLEAARTGWLPEPRINLAEVLFTKGGVDYFEIIRDQGGDTQRLMLVGHNPAVERTSQMLVGYGEPALRKQLKLTFPTAGIAIIQFDGGKWAEIQKGEGTITAFFEPKP